MLTVVIPYTGNKLGLVSLLTSLQPQLHPTDDIYIIDSTPDRSGLKIAAMYGTTRCYIFVEVGLYSYKDARFLGIQSAAQNGQKGVLVISDRCFISQTFIANLKKAAVFGHKAVAPKVVEVPHPLMESNFQWFNPPTTEVKKARISQLFCYYIPTEHTSPDMAVFENEMVVVLPYKTPPDKIN